MSSSSKWSSNFNVIIIAYTACFINFYEVADIIYLEKCCVSGRSLQANTKCWISAGLMLAHRLRRWTNIGWALCVCWDPPPGYCAPSWRRLDVCRREDALLSSYQGQAGWGTGKWDPLLKWSNFIVKRVIWLFWLWRAVSFQQGGGGQGITIEVKQPFIVKIVIWFFWLWRAVPFQQGVLCPSPSAIFLSDQTGQDACPCVTDAQTQIINVQLTIILFYLIMFIEG